MNSRIDPHTLKVLEFDRMAALLVTFASSELGRGVCRNITPQTDSSLIKERLNETSEMKSLIGINGSLPLSALQDLTPILKKAEPAGSFLTPRELWDVLVLARSSHEVKSFLKKDGEEHPAIGALSKKINTLKVLEKEVSAAIDAEGEILDSASSGIKSIRVKIYTIRKTIKSVLEAILNRHDYAQVIQEKYITLRHDRYVIPVKSDAKSQLPGVVHDQSKKQNTCFIEPFKVVELNNNLTLSKDEESREEMRILQRLTALVREKQKVILDNQACLGVLDSIQARARMSVQMEAREPELAAAREIRLFQSRHPILLNQTTAGKESEGAVSLDRPKVVAIDILFPADYSALVITGANMGGKTAALKTLGLLTLMVQAGLHIPVAEGSRLTAWETIFADIGDEQNLEENVSTFSSHIKQLNSIMKQANENSLVLLDELGAGTDPEEGSALVLAIMDSLRTRKAKVAVTSHLNLLKAYASSLSDVMNVSVGFNAVALKPTFELLYGLPGNSRALETAARLGIESQILDKAKAYLKESNRRILELIEDLQTTVQSILAIRKEFAEVLRAASRYEKAIITLAKKIETKKEDVFARVEGKARALFRQAESELKRIMKSARSTETTIGSSIKRDLSGVKKQLLKNLTKPDKTKSTLAILEKGACLVLGKAANEGEVVAIDYEANKVEVLIGDMRLKTSIDELENIEGVRVIPQQRQKGEAPGITTPFARSVTSSSPLKLIGLTVDEALPIVDKALDHALLCGEKDIHIIHGVGTGRLRKGIHDYLKQQPRIRAFYPAERLEGGLGVTVVELDS